MGVGRLRVSTWGEVSAPMGLGSNPIIMRNLPQGQGLIPNGSRKLLLLVLFALFVGQAQAKVITPDDLIQRILEANREFFQAYLELEVTVYDPEAKSPITEAAILDPIPVELPEQGFRQQITFIRDDFIGIETLSPKGQLQHVWLRSGFENASQAVNPAFAGGEADLELIVLSLFTRLPDKFRRHLGNWGIAPLTVKLQEEGEEVLYRFGQGDEFLLVHPKSFLVQEIQTTLQLQGVYLPLRVRVLERDREKHLFPVRIEYRINNRLFKTLRVTKLDYNSAPAKRTALLKTYNHLLPGGKPVASNETPGQKPPLEGTTP